MKDLIRQKLHEEYITKSDAKSEFKKYMDTSEFKSKIEKIVADKVKNDKALEDKVVEITKNVLTQLYKQLWTKRMFWRNGLSNKST